MQVRCNNDNKCIQTHPRLVSNGFVIKLEGKEGLGARDRRLGFRSSARSLSMWEYMFVCFPVMLSSCRPLGPRVHGSMCCATTQLRVWTVAGRPYNTPTSNICLRFVFKWVWHCSRLRFITQMPSDIFPESVKIEPSANLAAIYYVANCCLHMWGPAQTWNATAKHHEQSMSKVEERCWKGGITGTGRMRAMLANPDKASPWGTRGQACSTMLPDDPKSLPKAKQVDQNDKKQRLSRHRSHHLLWPYWTQTPTPRNISSNFV